MKVLRTENIPQFLTRLAVCIARFCWRIYGNLYGNILPQRFDRTLTYGLADALADKDLLDDSKLIKQAPFFQDFTAENQ